MTTYGVLRPLLVGLGRLLFRIRVHGREHLPSSGVYLVAPTHRSNLDVLFTAAITRRRIRFMAKTELFSNRIGRHVFESLGGIEVVRNTTDRGALRASEAALREGEPLAIFPEGLRHRGPELADLFDGVAYLALKLGIPIVPVGIGGSEEVLPLGKVLPRLHRVAVVVGEPIMPPPSDGIRRRSELGRVTEELRARLLVCFDEARSAAGGTAGSTIGGEETERS